MIDSELGWLMGLQAGDRIAIIDHGDYQGEYIVDRITATMVICHFGGNTNAVYRFSRKTGREIGNGPSYRRRCLTFHSYEEVTEAKHEAKRRNLAWQVQKLSFRSLSAASLEKFWRSFFRMLQIETFPFWG